MCWKVLGHPKQSSNWEIRPKNQATEVKNSLWKRRWASECLINLLWCHFWKFFQDRISGLEVLPSPALFREQEACTPL